MSAILDDYKTTLVTSSTPVSTVLKAIIDAPPLGFDTHSRNDLIQLILNDLHAANFGSAKGRLATSDNAQALLALKTLGKHPSGSKCISSPSNLTLLLRLSNLKDQETSSEALRCIANAMLLIEDARDTWIQNDVGGRAASVELLEKSSTPDRIFLASRILFLATVSSTTAGSFIRSLVEDKQVHSKTIVDIISSKLDLLNMSLLSGSRNSREAMTDLLKFVFNLLLHYPRLAEKSAKGKNSTNSPTSDDPPKPMGELWSHRLDDLLPPLLRVFNSLPPTFPSPMAPPLTHVVHALITIPINDTNRSQWIPGSPTAKSTRTSTPTGTPPSSSIDVTSTGAGNEAPSSFAREGNRASMAMDKALSVLAAGRRSLSRSPSPLPSTTSRTSDTLLRAFDLLEVSMAHYMPGNSDPDDLSVRDRARTDSDGSLDDLLSPLVVLITRLCVADEGSQRRLREWLVPADMDRTSALESKGDTLGRCLRILSCVYHERLKTSIGEMLFAMCNSDALTLSTYVGYGNVAGFLFNKGIMTAPPAPGTGPSASVELPDGINPITGTVQKKKLNSELDEMTEEEKEREAEKLFMLFDRLEKTGALPPSQNPIRKAVAEGKLGI